MTEITKTSGLTSGFNPQKTGRTPKTATPKKQENPDQVKLGKKGSDLKLIKPDKIRKTRESTPLKMGPSVYKALNDCLGLKRGEYFLVITDKEKMNIGRAFQKTAEQMGATAMLVEVPVSGLDGTEPPANVAKIWKEFDAFVAPTTYSLSHTKARREACEAGARGATLPGITEDILSRTLDIDYDEMKKVTSKLCGILDKGKEVKITSPGGTNLTFSIDGRKGDPDTGICNEKGDFTNLPGGEAYIAPKEGTANGILVVDGSMGKGLVDEPIRITIKDGRATKFEGGKSAREIAAIFAKQPPIATNIAEFGIGTNPAARIGGNILEDEKVKGTIHIALGNNANFGGKVDVPIHMDGIVRTPTFWVDGKKVMKDGELVD